MKPQLSPLELIDFAILSSTFKFIQPAADVDIRQLVNTYQIDIDFAINHQPEDTKVFIKASINRGESRLAGYSIFAEGVAIFNLAESKKLSDADKQSLLGYSSVSIAINSLRGFISSLTANAPFGRYILPSVDMNDLFKQKEAIQASLKANTKTKKVAKKKGTK